MGRKTTQQKEAVSIWREEKWVAEAKRESLRKAYYLPKYLRDIGETGHKEIDEIIEQMSKLAQKISDHYTTNYEE
jgi:hypothetical protein